MNGVISLADVEVAIIKLFSRLAGLHGVLWQRRHYKTGCSMIYTIEICTCHSLSQQQRCPNIVVPEHSQEVLEKFLVKAVR